MIFRKLDGWINNQYTTLLKEDGDVLAFMQFLYKLLIRTGVAVILLLLLDFFLITHGQAQSIGVFGDFFGGVLNPILTFLTFIALIFTMVMQKQESRSARLESKRSSIETTFFNIVDLNGKIVDNLKVDLNEIRYIQGNLSTLKEQIVAKRYQNNFEGRIVFEAILDFIEEEASSPQEAVDIYLIIQNRCNHMLGHYFRNLYQSLKIIDDNSVTMGDPKKYSSILRAQLSAKELVLLFYNCLDGVCDEGQFKNLLIQYEMLEHLPIKKVEGGYSLIGSEMPLASEEMFLQYQVKKNLPLNLTKYYGGAFGKNPDVPYNLRTGV